MDLRISTGFFKCYLKVECLGIPPAYQTAFSACADLHAAPGKTNGEQVAWNARDWQWIIRPGRSACIGSGLRIEDYYELEPDIVGSSKGAFVPELQVRPRSSLSKKGWMVNFGTIDMDYRDEIMINVRNESELPWIIKPGDRIAQVGMVLTARIPGIEVKTVTREGGFGSTGF